MAARTYNRYAIYSSPLKAPPGVDPATIPYGQPGHIGNEGDAANAAFYGHESSADPNASANAYKAKYGVDQISIGTGTLNYSGGELQEYYKRDISTGKISSPYSNVTLINESPGNFGYYDKDNKRIGDAKDPGSPQGTSSSDGFLGDIGAVFHNVFNEIGTGDVGTYVGDKLERSRDKTVNALEGVRESVGDDLEPIWSDGLRETGRAAGDVWDATQAPGKFLRDGIGTFLGINKALDAMGEALRPMVYSDPKEPSSPQSNANSNSTDAALRAKRKIRAGGGAGLGNGSLGYNSVLAGTDELGSGPGKRHLGGSMLASGTLLGM